MFSLGHIIWILISFFLVFVSLVLLNKFKIDTRKLLIICFILGAGSEIIKIITSMEILPMVRPEVVVSGEGSSLVYTPTGMYSPYLEVSHLPFELCSLMNFFILAAIIIKDERIREKLLTFMYVAGVIGGTVGIIIAYITVGLTSLPEFFTSLRVWQFFLYHAMIVTLGLYIGFVRENKISIRSIKSTLLILLCLDIPTFYINSVFSAPVYIDEKPSGLLYRANFFSSYVNPFGWAFPYKWQWIIYLLVRAALAVALIAGLLCLPALKRKLSHRN